MYRDTTKAQQLVPVPTNNMAISFNIVNTAELTGEQFSSIVKNFNAVFEKKLQAADLQRLYLHTSLGYSFHSLMEDGDNVAGYFSSIPFTYSCFGEEKIFCYVGGLFIMPEYRKDPLALFKLYAAAKKHLAGQGVSLLMAVPNNNAYPYFKHALKWKEVDSLSYHALPVRYGHVSKSSKLLNWLSVPAVYTLLAVQNILSSLANSREKQANIFLLRNEPLAEKQRYSDEHIKIRAAGYSAFYKMENEDGIRTSYLIDFYNKEGLRDSRSLYKAVNHIVKKEKPDLVLFIGPLRVKQMILFKVPQKKEPRALHFCAEILDKEHIGEEAYKAGAWNFGLYNFDVR